MSIIQPDSIKAIAHSVDITRLSDDAARTLAPDVEYRLREVVQEALKFAKHAKRTKLTTEDINNALRLRNVEPVFGFNSKDPAKFLRVAPNSELMYVQDPEVSFSQLIETALPKLPRIPGVTAHWLAINGVQPDLPENVSAGPLPKKRRQPLGLPGPGGRMGSLQEAAAAAAAAAVAGLDPSAASAGDPNAAAASGGTRLGSSAPSAAGQHQQQLLLGPGGSTIGPSPRSIAGAAVQLQLPLRHAVSRELQVYWDRIVDLLLSPAPQGSLPGFLPAGASAAAAAGGASGGGGHSGPAGAAGGGPDKQAVLTRALASVASDPGLHPLVPYMCAFIADGVKQHLMNLMVLNRLLLLTRALLANPDVHLAPYLQQLLPAVTTCIVTKTLGSHPSDDHRAVRREAAALLSTIARHFAAPHHNLQPRLCRVLAQALLDADKPLTSKYGAVVGLQALGPQVVRTLLIPHLEPFMSAVLIPAMTAGTEPDIPLGTANGTLPSQQQQQMQSLQRQLRQQAKAEAWQVYGALLSAVGSAMYDQVVGYMRGRLPVQLVLPRPGGAQGGSWQQQYTQTLLAARRRSAQQQQQQTGVQGAGGVKQDPQQQQQEGQGAGSASGAGSSQASLQVHRQQQGAVGGRPGLKGPPALLRPGRQGAAAAGGAGVGGSDTQQPSVAEVLGQSWREDSDVNATLGALLSLFGEDLLPCLPLPELAAVSL